jgi:hypothetical protein
MLRLARRIERWVLDELIERLQRVREFSELHGGASLLEATLPFSALHARRFDRQRLGERGAGDQ